MSYTYRIIPPPTTSLEVVIRAKDSLPFPPCKTANALIEGVIARAQRDEKVDLCNFVSMNNHFHFHVLPSDTPHHVCCFYGEIQKKLTDSLRSLLGKARLSLWEHRASMIRVESLDDVINRLVYIYTNPQSAGLCDSIETYPGLSSWQAFTSCKPEIDASVEKVVKWYPLKCLRRLPDNWCLTERQDASMNKRLIEHRNAVEQVLVIKPFKWLERYNITSPAEIDEIRNFIIARVREKERELRRQRQLERRQVACPKHLSTRQFYESHYPKKHERNIFIICKNHLIRRQLIQSYKRVVEECHELYDELKRGIQGLKWPEGVFIPWCPPNKFCAW
jgi:hypothetical protein